MAQIEAKRAEREASNPQLTQVSAEFQKCYGSLEGLIHASRLEIRVRFASVSNCDKINRNKLKKEVCEMST